MARRFRYSFARKQDSFRGRLSVILSGSALLLFALAVLLSGRLPGKAAVIPGVLSIFAMMLNCYGFGLGLAGFSEAGKKHTTCIVGSIVNGILLVGWLGLFQLGR